MTTSLELIPPSIVIGVYLLAGVCMLAARLIVRRRRRNAAFVAAEAELAQRAAKRAAAQEAMRERMAQLDVLLAALNQRRT